MNTTVFIILVVVLLVASLRLWLTANRLHRLHIRTEAAWIALEGALERRGVSARALALAGGMGPEQAALLRGLARRVEHTARGQRAHAEDELSRALERLPRSLSPELLVELADAQERVELARSFYNDAVRDTKALHENRFTRFFRLAGSAALPQYFEMSAPQIPTAEIPTGATARRSGRVLMVDENRAILLMRGHDPYRPQDGSWWFTPGGGAEPGESLATCAVRELREETGLVIHPGQLTGPIWHRRVRFSFLGQVMDSEEHFFVLRVVNAEVPLVRTGWTTEEVELIDEFRWWSRDELLATDEQVYPEELAVRFGELLAANHGAVLRPLPVS